MIADDVFAGNLPSRGYSAKQLDDLSKAIDERIGFDAAKYEQAIEDSLDHASIMGERNKLACMTDEANNWITPHTDARCDGGGMDAANASWATVYGEPTTDDGVDKRQHKYTFREDGLVTRDGQKMTHEEYTSIADLQARHGFLAKTGAEKAYADALRNAGLFIDQIGAEYVPYSRETLDELGFPTLSKVEQFGMDAVTSKNRKAYERERRLFATSGLMTMTDLQHNYEALQMTGSLAEAQQSHAKSGFMSNYASEFLDMHLSGKKVVFSTQDDLERYLGASADEAEFKEHINEGILSSLRESSWAGMQSWCAASIVAQTARQEADARAKAAASGNSASTTSADTTASSQKKRRRSSRPARPMFSVRPKQNMNGETHEQRTDRIRREQMARMEKLMSTKHRDTMSSSQFFSSSAPSTTSSELGLRSAMKHRRADRYDQETTVSSAPETSQSYVSGATSIDATGTSRHSFPTGAARPGANGETATREHSFPIRARGGDSSARSTLKGWTPERVRNAVQKGMRKRVPESTMNSCAGEMDTSAYSNNTFSTMPTMGTAA